MFEVMKFSLCRYFAILLLGCFSYSSGAAAQIDSSGCSEQHFQDGYFLEDGKRVFDDEKFQAFSIAMDTAVYAADTGPKTTAMKLPFDQRLLVSHPGLGTDRIQVRTLSDDAVGWVERESVLCRLLPLKDPHSGLLRRVVIRTDTAVQGQVEPKLAYHTPDRRCAGGAAACVKVSRFQWYFVYAEQKDHVLLSEAANLGGSDARLLGWLPKDDGISWNTAVALRPAEELETRKSKAGDKEDYVCAYPSLADVKDPAKCRQILGGRRWYNLNVRLPVIRDHGKVYEVAISSAASTGTVEETLAQALLSKLKNIDVFFVIDGTKSMQPVIDAIKGRPGSPGLVDQIRARLKGKIKQGGKIRFGYRIYRDSSENGRSGVDDEGMSLPSDCRSNEAAFVGSFKAVQATESPDDKDFAENMFGGLVRAARDIASCPDHIKILFVIGDHGYDPEAQRRRGQRVYDVSAIVKRFTSGRRLNTPPVVVMLQTPSTESQVRNPEAYRKSYDDYRTQSQQLLAGIYRQLAQQGVIGNVESSRYLHRMPEGPIDQSMIDRIIAPVDDFLQPDVAGKLGTRLRAGESLVEAINALRAGEAANVPILYWNVVAQALCKRLGKQCRQKVIEGVFTSFVERSDKLVPEVLLSQRQLHDWRELLGKFKKFWSLLRSGNRSRSQLINVLMESIGSVLKMEIDDSGRSIGDMMQYVGGLPHGAHSLLMAYSPLELKDKAVVPRCEIQHLVNYARKKADILRIVEDGEKLAIFAESQLPATACPGLTAKGKAVPYLPKLPTPRSLNLPDSDTTYSFRFQKGNDRYYWIQVGYLP